MCPETPSCPVKSEEPARKRQKVGSPSSPDLTEEAAISSKEQDEEQKHEEQQPTEEQQEDQEPEEQQPEDQKPAKDNKPAEDQKPTEEKGYVTTAKRRPCILTFPPELIFKIAREIENPVDRRNFGEAIGVDFV